MQEHFFSIIIASRNVDPYLITEGFPAINSLKYKQFEVLLILDAMDDDAKNMQQKYPWLQIIIRHNKPGDKRDTGARKAKGNIVAFIDGDVAPHKDWLTEAARIFTKRTEIAGLGGPGILPKKVNMWEKIFDEILQSWLGGGGYTYRFIPQEERYVDDYPSMNLFIKRDIFLKIGGFQNLYWPGEDSKMANNLVHNNNYKLLYHPDVIVYHHRRDSLAGHFDQYKRYGETRGAFFIQGDKNSFQFQYLIPGLFFMYMILYILSAILYLVEPYNVVLFGVISLPVLIYVIMLLVVTIQSFLQTKNALISLGVFVILPLTHMVYGFYFIRATMIEMFKKPSSIGVQKSA